MAQIVFIPNATTGGGGGGTSFDFVQSTPQTTWIVNHNLGRRPIVEVCSVGGQVLDANVLHLSLNQVQILFLEPTAGTVRCV